MLSSNDFMETPQSPPSLTVPPSKNTVRVYAIDNGARIEIQSNYLLVPDVGGKTRLCFPSYCFLIEHSSERKVLYDLGVRKDWENAAPSVTRQIQGTKSQIDVPENVTDVLTKQGIRREDIEAVIWSHFHFDHTGDMGTFASSTALVVGPDFKEKMTPGYPTNPDSPVLQSDFANRELREITFDQGLKIGRFNAYDYFGDGSFYLLDTPGHAIGHMCGFARTTANGSGDDTFVFLGGDCAHHCGEFRPTQYLPLPARLPASEIGLKTNEIVDGKRFLKIHPCQSAVRPFYCTNPRTAVNMEQCDWSLEGMEEFDAHPNVLTLAAHDETLLEYMENNWFPKTINGWKEAGLREKVMWRFLGDFPEISQGIKE